MSANKKEIPDFRKLEMRWRALHLSISTFSISLLVRPVSLPFRYVVAVYESLEYEETAMVQGFR